MKTRTLIISIVVVLILIGIGFYLSWLHSTSRNASQETNVIEENMNDQGATGTSREGGLIRNAPTSTLDGSEVSTSSVSTEVGGEASVTTDTSTPAPKTVTVSYTNAGYSPKTITIHQGDTVQWVNNSSVPMWTASGQHPSHTQYDGTSREEHCAAGYSGPAPFDACKGYAPGTSYSFTFEEIGSFGYHNHISTNDTGEVIVE